MQIKQVKQDWYIGHGQLAGRLYAFFGRDEEALKARERRHIERTRHALVMSIPEDARRAMEALQEIEEVQETYAH